MNQREKTYRLSRSRVVCIDDELAGRPLRLAILGRSLKHRPGQCWATTLFKSQDHAEFAEKAGRALDKVARPMDGFGFHFENQTDKTVTLAGFPTVNPKSRLGVELDKDGKWISKP